MTGAEDKPLLILDRVGEGRVALLTSDQVWLWGRGFEGGGPQLELLRRIAHWSMKEPELEEEALLADVRDGLAVRFTRRTMQDSAGPLQVTAPDGSISQVPLAADGPGRFVADWTAPEPGLYRLADGDMRRVLALGPAAPREFEETVADAPLLTPVVEASGGRFSVCRTACRTCARRVRAGRPAAMAWAAPGSASPRAMRRPSPAWTAGRCCPGGHGWR